MKIKNKMAMFALCLASLLSSHGYGKDSPIETVYTLSNDAVENAVLAFRRNRSGEWRSAGRYATGGAGSGSGLGNQGALALSENGRYLFAVNAGSDEVSVFRVVQSGLELLDHSEIIGDQPVSVTTDHNLVYAVNAGDDSIFGLHFDPRSGTLTPLPDSYYPLSENGSAPAQISFNPGGTALVVTEKASNRITTFSLDQHGLPISSDSMTATGITPFGFAFGKRDRFFVSEANNGLPGGATVSSYEIMRDGTVGVIAGAVAVNQTAACWLVVTPNGRLAFTANTPAGTLSSFSIDASGHLSLLEEIAAQEEAPRDMAIANDGKSLFTLNGGDNSISVFKVSASGKLQKMQNIDGLPLGFTGLLVR